MYKKIRPGRAASVESAESLINRQCSSIREDMILPKLDVINLIRNSFQEIVSVDTCLAEDVVDPSTGEFLQKLELRRNRELADKIQNAAVPYVWIQGEEEK